MIKVNARVLQLVKHHDCSIYFRYSITRAHTYVIMILCVSVAMNGHLPSDGKNTSGNSSPIRVTSCPCNIIEDLWSPALFDHFWWPSCSLL